MSHIFIDKVGFDGTPARELDKVLAEHLEVLSQDDDAPKVAAIVPIVEARSN